MGVADLHIHVPMSLLPEVEDATAFELLITGRGRPRLRDRLRARIVALLARLINHPSPFDGWRVSLPGLREGDVSVALSVLYSPFAEMDLDERYGARPQRAYLDDVLRQIDVVADAVAERPDLVEVATDPVAMDRIAASGRTAVVHCLEGGFHLGGTPEDIRDAAHRLAGRGVAYVTLAHLFWRSVATNAPALPFLPDPLYRRIFPQPDVGLTELGREAVRALVAEGVLVDVAHMTPRARAETFALLDAEGAPVICSHAGFRFGKQEYMLDDEDLKAIRRRDGVVGLIFAEHQILDGARFPKHTTTAAEAVQVLRAHIDAIAAATGDREHRHVAIGSDLDGFIKPTLGGLGKAEHLSVLHDLLVDEYGEAATQRILEGNVRRVLHAGWRGSPG